MRRKGSRKLVGCPQLGLGDRACDARQLEKGLPCPVLAAAPPGSAGGGGALAVSVVRASRDGLKGGYPLK